MCYNYIICDYYESTEIWLVFEHHSSLELFWIEDNV